MRPRPRFNHVHMVGIGGIGMCGIAEVLLQLGFRISGSDLRSGPTTERLARLGATLFIGHAETNVEGADVVVTSSAVPPDNPEVLGARARGIPVIPRAEMLAELMRLKDGVAIAGSHGKTTTTSLAASVLTDAGLDPTVIIGGRHRTLGATSRLGKGELLVAEADESDRSFLLLSPVIAVVTNVDDEHMENYDGSADLDLAFERFLNKVPFWSAAVICIDDPRVAAIKPRLRRRTVTYGLDAAADLRATDVWTEGHRSGYVLHRLGERLGEVTVGLPGLHNVRNSLAVAAVALELGVSFETLGSALARFEGVDRRLDVKGEADSVLVVDDYGHHPTEIRATLDALATAYHRPLVAIVEPHRYSRVRDHIDRFATAFDAARDVLVTDLYAAGEAPLPGIDAATVAARISAAGHPSVRYAGSVDEAARAAAELARPGDLVVTRGAGAVTRAADAVLEILRARE